MEAYVEVILRRYEAVIRPPDILESPGVAESAAKGERDRERLLAAS
jgi:hypothetical protein